MARTAPKVSQTELRSLLGCFLFSGDDVFKPLGVLSGGERNRYALARILVSPANFLLLDEPTNHLDLRAKDVLLEAVNSFTGTVDLRLARSLLHRSPGDARLRSRGRPCPRVSRAITKIISIARQNGTALVDGSLPSAANGSERHRSSRCLQRPRDRGKRKATRLNPIKLRQMQERYAFVEEEIPRVEAQIAETEHALGIFVSMEETQQPHPATRGSTRSH